MIRCDGGMRWVRVIGIMAVAAAVVGYVGAWSSQAEASQDDDDPQATIEALQTQVAEQAEFIATLTASPTPQATVEAEVVPEASSEPIDLGGGVVLASYLMAQPDDDLYVFIDLINQNDEPILSPSVDVSFFDTDGNFLGTEDISSDVQWAAAGSHIPMSGCCILDGAYDLSDIGDVTFAAVPETYYTYEEVDASNLEITGTPIEGDDEGVSGRIMNNGTEPVEEIVVIYATYDADGVLVGNCYTYLGVTIPPQKSAKFSVGGGCLNTDYGKDASEAKEPYTYRLFVTR